MHVQYQQANARLAGLDQRLFANVDRQILQSNQKPGMAPHCLHPFCILPSPFCLPPSAFCLLPSASQVGKVLTA